MIMMDHHHNLVVQRPSTPPTPPQLRQRQQQQQRQRQQQRRPQKRILQHVLLTLTCSTVVYLRLFGRHDDFTITQTSTTTITTNDPSNVHHRRDTSVLPTTTATSSSTSFDDFWTKVSNKMCPNMRPNLRYGDILFDLAWNELRQEPMFQLLGSNTNNTTSVNDDSHPAIQSHSQSTARSLSSSSETVTTTTTTSTNPYVGLTSRIRRRHSGSVTTEQFYDHSFWGFVVYGDKRINTDYFVYTTIWKSANNYIKEFMKQEIKERYNNGQYFPDWQPHDIFYSPKYPNNKYTNPNDTFCIVTAIRDPISHFLSGYNEIEYRSKEWRNDWASPGQHNHNNTYEQYPNPSNERFIQFVADIIHGTATEMSKRHFDIYHTYSQMKVLSVLSKFNQTLNGYLSTLTNIEHTWPTFIAQTCPNALPLEFVKSHQQRQRQQRQQQHLYGGDHSNHTHSHNNHNNSTTHHHHHHHHHGISSTSLTSTSSVPVQVFDGGKHDSSNDTWGFYQTAKNVWNDQSYTARALCMLHAFDYACWPTFVSSQSSSLASSSKSKSSIPELCQQTYQSIEFRNAILYN